MPVESPAVTAEPVRLHYNENPLGASPQAVAAVEAELRSVNRYPDPAHTDLIGAIARHAVVGPDRVAVGNGVDEVILMLALAWRADPRPAAVSARTFQSYARSLRAAGVPYVAQPLRGYDLDADRMAESFADGVGLAFVCNPLNPTGTVLSAASVRSLCKAARRYDAVVVFDEAYGEYVPPGEFESALPHAASGHNVCVLRTFSKAYGLGALRVGYLVGDPAVVARVTALQGAFPFHVNRFAQAAAVRALADQEFVELSRRENDSTRAVLCAGLDALGVAYVPSRTNFVLIRLPGVASRVAVALRALGVLVRDTADLGLADHLRVSVGRVEQVRAFLRDLETILRGVGER
ncbi:histidinol-phosphate transaminase [Actinokineospora auranticolor]|uniref:Histidinol-phosphate aminotransferase n=1 Tax=Actinokineospora auranticolor TaxID=155976 RepID=A0A2S6H1E7_9PSEU|nr:histidinol-phosphate transaminase [Actinokineospora auranticolor]PPK71293.1 histidinol-phosphate aminotransferase [Actinokineospora auranticolor]